MTALNFEEELKYWEELLARNKARDKTMTSTDYVNAVVAKQPKLFVCKAIQITPEEMKRLLQIAFESGQLAARSEKSVWEQVFGTSD